MQEELSLPSGPRGRRRPGHGSGTHRVASEPPLAGPHRRASRAGDPLASSGLDKWRVGAPPRRICRAGLPARTCDAGRTPWVIRSSTVASEPSAEPSPWSLFVRRTAGQMVTQTTHQERRPRATRPSASSAPARVVSFEPALPAGRSGLPSATATIAPGAAAAIPSCTVLHGRRRGRRRLRPTRGRYTGSST